MRNINILIFVCFVIAQPTQTPAAATTTTPTPATEAPKSGWGALTSTLKTEKEQKEREQKERELKEKLLKTPAAAAPVTQQQPQPQQTQAPATQPTPQTQAKPAQQTQQQTQQPIPLASTQPTQAIGLAGVKPGDPGKPNGVASHIPQQQQQQLPQQQHHQQPQQHHQQPHPQQQQPHFQPQQQRIPQTIVTHAQQQHTQQPQPQQPVGDSVNIGSMAPPPRVQSAPPALDTQQLPQQMRQQMPQQYPYKSNPYQNYYYAYPPQPGVQYQPGPPQMRGGYAQATYFSAGPPQILTQTVPVQSALQQQVTPPKPAPKKMLSIVDPNSQVDIVQKHLQDQAAVTPSSPAVVVSTPKAEEKRVLSITEDKSDSDHSKSKSGKQEVTPPTPTTSTTTTKPVTTAAVASTTPTPLPLSLAPTEPKKDTNTTVITQQPTSSTSTQETEPASPSSRVHIIEYDSGNSNSKSVYSKRFLRQFEFIRDPPAAAEQWPREITLSFIATQPAPARAPKQGNRGGVGMSPGLRSDHGQPVRTNSPNLRSPKGVRGVQGGNKGKFGRTDSTPTLRTSESGWKPNRLMKPADAESEMLKKIQGMLNKLTEENYEKLSQKIAVYTDKEELREGIIKLIFEKAVLEPKFARMYANLCVKLSKRYAGAPDEKNPDPKEKESKGEKKNSFLFRKKKI